MKKIFTIFLIICLMIISTIACAKKPAIPIVGLYTTTETIEVIGLEDYSSNLGSDAVKCYKITLRIKNISKDIIHISYDNFECAIDNGEIIDFFWDEKITLDVMAPFSLDPGAITTEYLYIKVPIDTEYIRFGAHTNYDSAWYTIKTPD